MVGRERSLDCRTRSCSLLIAAACLERYPADPCSWWKIHPVAGVHQTSPACSIRRHQVCSIRRQRLPVHHTTRPAWSPAGWVHPSTTRERTPPAIPVDHRCAPNSTRTTAVGHPRVAVWHIIYVWHPRHHIGVCHRIAAWHRRHL